jgi:Tfp pilus assembly protein PilO
MRRVAFCLIVTSLVVGQTYQALAQGFHERREQRLADSANQNASAEEIKKAKGLTIETANKDVGQMKTEFQITMPEKPHQHGMRYLIDLRKISQKETGVKVVGLEQVRTFRLQAEPWELPTYNAEASGILTKAIVDATSTHG